MKTVAIVQARMSSKRLPGKVLLPIGDRPMLALVLERARAAKSLDGVVVATSVAPADDAIEAFCQSASLGCFRGSEDDVLDRYYRTAEAYGANLIVRLTADCPFLDPTVIDVVVEAFNPALYDYVSNTVNRRFPDGLDTEVFSSDALARAWREAKLMSEREHVTPYIWKHPELFQQRQVLQDRNLASLRWTVDEPRDLEFVRAIYARLGPRLFGMNDVVDLMARESSLAEINAGIGSNEGYHKSLREDRRAPEA